MVSLFIAGLFVIDEIDNKESINTSLELNNKNSNNEENVSNSFIIRT